MDSRKVRNIKKRTSAENSMKNYMQQRKKIEEEEDEVDKEK